jgi:hypothetical protein
VTKFYEYLVYAFYLFEVALPLLLYFWKNSPNHFVDQRVSIIYSRFPNTAGMFSRIDECAWKCRDMIVGLHFAS